MGDAASGPLRLSFNRQLRVEFRGATVTSDAGLLLPRELDERLGLGTLIEGHLSDPRTGHNRQFPLPDLVRQSNQWYPRREWPVSPTPHRQNGLVGVAAIRSAGREGSELGSYRKSRFRGVVLVG